VCHVITKVQLEMAIETNVTVLLYSIISTFRVSHRQREMRNVYWSQAPVCLSVPRHIPTLLHAPGSNSGEW